MAQIDELLAQLTPERRELLAAKLRQQNAPRRPRIPQIPRDGRPIPLSFAQQRLWFFDRFEPGSAAFNVPMSVLLEGELSYRALRTALADVVERHETLRTTFSAAQDGEPIQRIEAPFRPALPVVDFATLANGEHGGAAEEHGGERQQASRRFIDLEVRRSFDLASGPLLRAHLLRLGPHRHRLLLNLHHIITDGWSMGRLVWELAAAYEARQDGKAPVFEAMPVQYGDFAAWQRQTLQGEALEETLSYWRRRLEGAPPELVPIPDRRRGAAQTYRGARLPIALEASAVAPLKALSEGVGASLFMVLLALFQVLLSRACGTRDVVLGTLVANRQQREIEPIVGFFVNNLVLRGRVEEGESLRQLVERVKGETIEAYRHQELPFEKLVEELNPQRNLAIHPLFQVLFVLQNATSAAPTRGAGGLTLTPEAIDRGTANFDLTLSLEEQPGGALEGFVEYNTDLYDLTTAARLRQGFRRLVRLAGAAPERRLGELDSEGAARRHLLLREWNDRAARPGAALPPPLQEALRASVAGAETGGFPSLFAAAVEAYGESVACEGPAEESLTYRQLAAAADRFADGLQHRGVRRGDVVALLCPRGPRLLIAFLSCLRLGAAYLPLDPLHPPTRLAAVLEESSASLVLASGELQGVLGEALERVAEGRRPSPGVLEEVSVAGDGTSELPDLPGGDDLAYVLFTSGSTGRPKGAMLRHRGMINHLEAKVLDLDLVAEDAVAQNASQAFDISVWQMLCPLVVGARVVFYDDQTARDAQALPREVQRRGVTILETVPALLRMLLAAEEELPPGEGALGELRWMIPTGEALTPDLTRAWRRRYPQVPLLNAYGPTECSDDVSHHRVRQADVAVDDGADASSISIGRPVVNTQLYVVDRQLRPLPLGAAGELVVGGDGVGLGYLQRPARTAASFVPDPFHPESPSHPDVPSYPEVGARLYRTGDLARWRPDGSLDFLGRIDHQVKIRGHRIELGEIEARLEEYAGLSQAVVLVREDVPGDHRLVAYVVPKGAAEETAASAASLDTADLRAFLKDRLPDPMLPSAFVPLEVLPTNTAGKVDRKALPAPEGDLHASGADYEAPRDEVEEVLAEIYGAVIGVERVGVFDSFFELGGHSLLVTQVVARVREELGVELPLRVFFESPTVAELSARVEEILIAELEEMSEEEALAAL